MNESATRRPQQFLADLTQAMSATAETARQAQIEQCRTDAAAYTEYLRARQADETVSMRQASEVDVVSIRDWSKAELDRARLETEERIALRRRQLESELAEYDSAVEAELRRVDDQIQSWQADLAVFFERLVEDTNPATFAAMATRMPDPPAFGEPDPERIVRDLRAGSRGATPTDAGPAAGPAALPDHWWMESPASLAARARSMAGSGQPG